MSMLPPELYAALTPSGHGGYHLPGIPLPLSVTEDEGAWIHAAILTRGLRAGYEMATGFGMSSFYAGAAFAQTGGDLISIDAYSEERAQDNAAMLPAGPVWEPRGLVFAMTWRDALALPIRYAVARSPIDTPAVLSGRRVDYVFIDGNHADDAPWIDASAALPFLAPRGLFVFHDAHERAVWHAAERIGERLACVPVCVYTRYGLAVLEWGTT